MASGGGDARSLRVESYVPGYHVYQRIWNPFVGEVAVAVREEGNVHGRYAVAIQATLAAALTPSSSITTMTFQGLPGPRLGFFLGGSAEGVQQIGSGSSTRSKNFVILPAPAIATFLSRSFTPVPTKAYRF